MPVCIADPRAGATDALGTRLAVEADHRRWALALFHLSVLKQRKWREVARSLGPTGGLRCLDVGADNGVISYLLRRQGGSWASADLDAASVAAIRSMVGDGVVQVGQGRTPFRDAEFDRVVLVDCLEHLPDDRGFLEEMARITRVGGALIANVPLRKENWLRRFRLAIGQTDEAHGHVRHGYTPEELGRLLAPAFELTAHRTYSKFFSEAIDTVLTWGIRRLKRRGPGRPGVTKGTFVTGQDLARRKPLFLLYAVLYPVVWSTAQLDRLLWFRSGYMLIAAAVRRAPDAAAKSST